MELTEQEKNVMLEYWHYLRNLAKNNRATFAFTDRFEQEALTNGFESFYQCYSNFIDGDLIRFVKKKNIAYVSRRVLCMSEATYLMTLSKIKIYKIKYNVK